MCLIMVLMRFVRRNNMIGFVIWSKYTIRSVVGYWCDGGTIVIMAAYSIVIVKKYEEK